MNVCLAVVKLGIRPIWVNGDLRAELRDACDFPKAEYFVHML